VSRGRNRTLSSDLAALTRQLEHGKPQPKAHPVELPLASIKLWPGAFQHRGRRGGVGERHVRDLTVAIKRSPKRSVEPIQVWWDGKGWACIDGHHRLDAYKAAALGPEHRVPVAVFAGTLAQAMAAAASANTKDKLPMSSAEKSNAAWRMVNATDMSKAEVAAASGVSESTVAAMRRVHAVLIVREAAADALATDPGGAPMDLAWRDAKRLAEGREAPDFDRGAANEAKAQEMALAIRRAIGSEGGKYPEILARALDIYDSRLMEQLVEWWGGQEDDDETADVAVAEL
jgi:hypothetical protein